MNTNVTGTFQTPTTRILGEQYPDRTGAIQDTPSRPQFEVEPVEMTVFVDLDDSEVMADD